ncbi:MAG: ribose 5-phosphate isomerase A [Desulfurococcaceae archaeon]|jgi:ribose 5-phosphate isomerase A
MAIEHQVERAKLSAASEACNLLKQTLKRRSVIGVGTGSTVKKFIDVCHDFLREHLLVASSPDTALYLKDRYRISVFEVLTVDEVDVYVDGADEVSSKLDLVKGRGGALLREKTLAYMSQTRIYIVDYTKFTGVDYLYAKLIPVEVVPFAFKYVAKAIARLGSFQPILREGGGKDGPVVTDNGNYILDLKPLAPIYEPAKVHQKLKNLHGVVETGVFPAEELVDMVVVGYADKALILRRGGA